MVGFLASKGVLVRNWVTGSGFVLQIPGWDSSFSCKTSPFNPLKVVFSVIRSNILLKPML